MNDPKKWRPIELVNVVVTGETNYALDLDRLSNNLWNSEYFPKKFAALKLCRASPFAKALVFRSGKIVCVGAVTIEFAIDSLDWFIQQIQSVLGEIIQLESKKVQNLVGSTSLFDSTVSVNLSKLFQNCSGNCQYEPE